jgi:hypothetical protein
MAAPHSDPKAFPEWYESDYYRRPRPLRRAKVRTALAAAVLSLVVVAGTLLPRNRTAYQAGPLSPPHAPFNTRCNVCHTEEFAPALRFFPSNSAVRSAPDEACLVCHPAGGHGRHQLKFSGADGQSANCAECHREHFGAVSLTRISDKHCTTCHANLPTDDDRHRFAATIRGFDASGGHPGFGAWRGPGGLKDPGTIRFNHKAHLELPEKLKDVPAARLGAMAEYLPHLADQSCTWCHQPDGERRYILTIRYESHCAGCHPLTSRPAGEWPAAVSDAWAKTPLPHPARGETAQKVRAALLERYFRLLAKPHLPAANEEPVRPPVLSAPERDRAKQLAGQTEARVFAADGGDVISELEKPFFQLKGGCAYCHLETSKPDARPVGLPVYALPHLRGRWDDVTFPDERFGPMNGNRRSEAEQAARDRWFPYSRFNHDRHRELDCQACHRAAESTKTSDLLLPTIEDCRKCHGSPTAGARADCLECHLYHDRSRERHGLRGRMSIEDARQMFTGAPQQR